MRLRNRSYQSMDQSAHSRLHIISVALLMLLSADSSAAYSIGRVQLQTRSSSTSSTAFYVSNPAQVQSLNPLTELKYGSAAHNEDEQQVVDEYLEFLERRYRRLHGDEVAKTKTEQVKFSAWNWLSQSEESHVLPVEGQKTQDDALFVLGVAGLASKKLLQKHHSSRGYMIDMRRSSHDMEPVSVLNSVDVEPEKPSSKIAMEVSILMNKVSACRKQVHKFQTEKAKKLIAYLAVAPFKAVSAAWKFGGGKKNVLRTVAITAALMVVLVRPLAHMVANEGANMTRVA